MSGERERARVLISGRVQGVYFRQSTARRAAELGVDGWVRNLDDGRVEAVFEGTPAQVRAALEYVRRGPERARVDAVEISRESADGEHGFTIR